MDFSGAIGNRPVRLSEKTRAFAYESLQGKYGDEAMGQYAIPLDDIENFNRLSSVDRYDLGLRRVCEKAPIRICPEETVSGSANMGMAIDHGMPVTFGGKCAVGSVCHLTLQYERAVNEGIDSFEKRIAQSRKQPGRTVEELRFLDSLQNVIDGMHIYHRRYLEELRRKNHPVAAYFESVPFAPPTSFKEALQSLWFCFAFTRLFGNWPGIGRIDKILGPYLSRDLKAGTITLDEARELLAGFFIKGCEWIRSAPERGSGDAQHYQNLVLGGLDEKGEDTVNEVSYLILDVIEELPIGDFPVTVRLSDKTPEPFRRRIAEVLRYGGGVLALYNERLILESMKNFGYPTSEALNYANDGCWEVQVPGATCFIYYPFDALRLLLDNTLHIGEKDFPVYGSFEELKEAYLQVLRNYTKEFTVKSCVERRMKQENGQWRPIYGSLQLPVSVVSLFEDDCIERAKAYYSGGARYTSVSPHIGGVPDVANSLYAIKKLVFDEEKISYKDLIQLLGNNWEGGEMLRIYAANCLTYYGNADFEEDGADDLAKQILHCFASAALEVNKTAPILTPPGVSTFGRQIQWAPMRKAVPFGRKAGEILSGNLSPTPGTDREGATAAILSYGHCDLSELSCGSALDIQLLPDTVSGENGVETLMALMEGFLQSGGFFIQMDVANADVLRDAQKNPELYHSLSVRVSGWNARFITLDEHWQEMIIERLEGKRS